MQPQTIIFIGPQGRGKGTQSAQLMAYLREQDPDNTIVEIQTGRGFRELKEQQSYTGQRVQDLYDQGGLMPDFLTEAVVVHQLMAELTERAHLFMDGFPRNLEQARFLDEILRFYLRETISVVYLDTPESVSRERLRERARSDDTEETITKRLRLYHEMTAPVLDHYRNRPQTNLITIDGTETIEEVQSAIKNGIGI